MRNEPLILALLLFVPGLAAAGVSPSFPSGEVYFEFNEPKGSVQTFDVEKTLILTNPGNESVTFSGLTVAVEGVSGVTVSLGATTMTVSSGLDEKVTLTFHAASSMAEGEYSGTLEVSGTEVVERSISITIEIDYPPPTINATWDPAILESLKAGSKLSYTLIVSEVLGYASAEDVNVSIYDIGPAENIAYSGSLGDFDPLTLKEIEVNFSIPERNLKPGEYSISPFITSSSTIRANAKELNYLIPVPEMEINGSTRRTIKIDFGKITFETGKDTGKMTLNINETGGYTPIETLSVSLVNGEDGWITYSEIDYIPAGKSESYDFDIFLPPDASLGLKSWDFKLSTSYAGSKDIHAVVIVSFPGTDEAIASLKNTSIVTNSTEERNLIRDTISLLETSKDKTQLRKIAMVMSVYSGTHTFLKNLGTVAGSREESVEAGDAIIRAKAALNKIEIGDQNLKDAELKRYSSKVVSSAGQIWNSEAENILNSLEEGAENKKDSNYKLTALYYDRISKIYALFDEPQNAKKYSEKQGDIEKLYHNSLLEAGGLTRDADSKLDSARKRTFSPGKDTYIVLNPFSYDFVSGTYNDAVNKYEKAEALYRKAGEESDADLLKDELEEITRQKNNIYRTFIVYGSFLGLIFLWFIARVVWGIQHYSQDEMDGRWGDVITGEKAEAVGSLQTEPKVTEEIAASEKPERE
ncbi:MAG: hypothetical protein V3V63_02350 [Candidatus Hydrothermarchaeaceae archaeon]